jgi:hypothetical protein
MAHVLPYERQGTATNVPLEERTKHRVPSNWNSKHDMESAAKGLYTIKWLNHQFGCNPENHNTISIKNSEGEDEEESITHFLIYANQDENKPLVKSNLGVLKRASENNPTAVYRVFVESERHGRYKQVFLFKEWACLENVTWLEPQSKELIVELEHKWKDTERSESDWRNAISTKWAMITFDRKPHLTDPPMKTLKPIESKNQEFSWNKKGYVPEDLRPKMVL